MRTSKTSSRPSLTLAKAGRPGASYTGGIPVTFLPIVTDCDTIVPRPCCTGLLNTPR